MNHLVVFCRERGAAIAIATDNERERSTLHIARLRESEGTPGFSRFAELRIFTRIRDLARR